MAEDLSLSDIDQYYGTQGYANVMGVNVTDGVRYVMENGYSWSVTDAIVILKMNKKVRRESFVHLKLRIQEKKGKGNEAIMYYEDGNGNVLYRQKYKWTNAHSEFDMYFTNGVLMLQGEY